MNNNFVIKLSNKESYYVVAIAPYNGEKYYITNHLTDDAKSLTDYFVIFQEYIKNEKIKMKKIDDENLIYEI